MPFKQTRYSNRKLQNKKVTMIIYKYKTSVQTEEQADSIIRLLQIFYVDAILSFNLLHPDKLLLIESQDDEDHSDIVADVIKKFGCECEVLIEK